MPSYIVCPDGTTYLDTARVTPGQLGGRPYEASDPEAALLRAYDDGYAKFPAMKHYDNRDVTAWVAARDARILAAARRVIGDAGMRAFTRRALAREANMSDGAVSNFGVSSYLKDKPSAGYRERILAALMRDAIDQGDISMIRVGIADGCLRGDEVPEGLRAAAGV